MNYSPLAIGATVWIALRYTGDVYGFVAGKVTREYEGRLPHCFVKAVDPQTHEIAELKVHRSKVTQSATLGRMIERRN